MSAAASAGAPLKAFLLAIALGAFAARAGAQAPSDRYAETRAFLQKTVASTGVPSLSVAIFRDGRVDFEEAYGWADREAGLKASPRIPYSLASISKPFTATGLMVLAQRGEIALDAPINDYLGSARLTAQVGAAKDATVRRVANHTSGLPFHVQFFYYDEAARRPSPAVTIAHYGRIVEEPGTLFAYSNLGFGVLGHALEVRSGLSYGAFMKGAVFDPLDLRQTFVAKVDGLGGAAARYGLDGARLPFYDTDHPGASEIYSSAHDLIRFAAFHLKMLQPGQTPILSDASLDEMHRSSTPKGLESYGIGFEINDDHGYAVVAHGGSMPGVATEMMLVPDKGVAIVVLCNSWSNAVVTDVTNHIATSILPDWKNDKAPKTVSNENTSFAPSAALVGRWVGKVVTPDGDRTVVLELPKEGPATASISGGPPAVVDAPAFADGELTGGFNADLDVKDLERFRHTFHIALRLRDGRLRGGIIGVGNFKDPYIVAGLNFFTDLRRAP